jgi:hypothetical protein
VSSVVQALPPTLASTRASLHALAEQVLCAVRYQDVGRVGLTPWPDGLGTPPFGDNGRAVGVRGTELVDVAGESERRTPVTTLRAAGAFFGVAPGAPDLWTPVTMVDGDAPSGSTLMRWRP